MRPYGTLLNSANFYELECRGDFRAAERYMQSCLDSRLKYLSPEDEPICSAYVNLGNISASRFRFEEAIARFKKADSLVLKHGNEWPMKRLLVDINIARAYYSVGKYTDAAIRLDSALEETSRYKNRFWAVRSVKGYPPDVESLNDF
jgi:tetratricopeptide (TPR) repeat protein